MRRLIDIESEMNAEKAKVRNGASSARLVELANEHLKASGLERPGAGKVPYTEADVDALLDSKHG